MLSQFLMILLLMMLNAFFVAAEFAIVASRTSRLESLVPGSSRAKVLVRTWIESPQARDRILASCQLGVTVVSLALGAVGEKAFEHLLAEVLHDVALPPFLQMLEGLLPALPLILSLVVVTGVHVVFGEQVPKVAALRFPERTALLSALPLQLFTVVFGGFVSLLDAVTRAVLRLFNLEMAGHGSVYSLEELRHILEESEEMGLIPAEGGEMIHAVLDLGELTVRQVMVPRTEIVAVPADTPFPEVIRLASEHLLTKLPVYRENLDNIIGILHIKDVLRYLDAPDFAQRTAAGLVREPLFVPENMSVNTLLRRFRDSRQHLAIVVDEFGGTAGLVTLEDLMEEIIGEVGEPFEEGEPSEIEAQPDGSFLVDGQTLLEDVNEALGLQLSEPHYDTIAGFVLGRLGRVPQPGEVVEADGVRLQVLEMDGLRIARLRLERLPAASPAKPTQD